MKQELHFIYAILFLLFSPYQSLIAQDNLQVAFSDPSSVPDFLNICGDPDTATVTVSIKGLSPDSRTDILATLQLFKGVELTSFLASGSSAGVTLSNNADPNNPIFSLPDLGPNNVTEVDISFLIAAKCGYIDTLNQNNAIQVSNTWSFDYNMGGNNFIEEEMNTEYRDAFAVPSFTTEVNSTHGPARVNDCFSREVVITNSGLDGFISQMEYENRQGDGIYISSITANGIPLTINKTLLVTGDTLITGTLDAAIFANNTIGGGAGNGDGNFDPNETVTIIENLCVLDCDRSRASLYNFSWGCDTELCNVETTSDFIQIGEGAPNIAFVDSGSMPNVNVGYCQQGFYAFTFNNNGVEVDAGFGTMLNVQAGLGLNLDGSVSGFSGDDGFTVSEVTLAGVVIPFTEPQPIFDLGSLLLFNSDPDGAGGLDDFDGDGFYDDLPVGESFEMTITYDFDCTQAQGIDENCVNDFSSIVEARIVYTDACGVPEIKDRTNLQRFSNRNSDSSVKGDIDAVIEVDTFYITHRQERNAFSFEKNCGGGEEYRAWVVLPSGVQPIISEINLVRNPSATGSAVPPIPLKSNMISNDTLYLSFDAAATAFIGGTFELEMGFMADCSAAQDFVFMPYEFSFYCPPCDCSHTWFCDTLQGPKLHVEEPPCPLGTFVCPVGVATKSFEVNRTTFGYTDATYTTPFDPLSDPINSKAALSCDLVEMRLVNVVGDAPITDSIGVLITHDNIDDSYDSIQTFIFNEATVRFTNAGSEYFCTVDTTILSITTIDSTQYLNFDLNTCLTSLGLTLIKGDTIEFLGEFKINEDGPIGSNYSEVPNFRAYGYANVNGVEESCDHFGENFTLKKISTGFLWPTSTSFPKGCQDRNLEFSLILGNAGYSDFFPNEFRQAIKIDSFVLDFDPAVIDAYSIFEPQVAILNHPVHGNSYFPVESFELFPDGHYVVRFDTLTTVPPIVNGQSYPFRFRIRAVPSCESEFGSSNDDNLYLLNSEIHFEDRYYAKEIGDGSCSDERIEAVAQDMVYSDPPSLSLTPLSNPNFILAEDTAIWELQMCNTSFIADAGASWISFEDPTGSIQVVSMEDITVPDSTPVYAVQQYGSGGENYFAFAPALTRGSSSATFNEICNVVRIKALVNQCGTTNFTAKVGWNCVEYTDLTWNPEDHPPCAEVSTSLSVITLDPALDANIIAQPTVDPSICDTNTIEILLRNTDLGVAKDIVTQIILPMTGATLVPGSVELAYPSSAAYVAATAEPVFTGTSSRGNILEYNGFSNLNSFLDQNGLPGFDTNNPTIDSNQLKIRYKFVSDCDFVSGSINYYSFQGVKNCGDSTNYETGETLPINIDGVNAGVGKIFNIGFSPNSILIPNNSSTLEITATNLTNTPSDAGDKVSLMLPMGVLYEANSTVVIAPSSWVLAEPTIEIIGGYQNLKWNLPVGLLQNESATFSLSVTSPDYDCTVMNVDAGLNTIEEIDLFCDALAANCIVEANTSTNNGALTNIPVFQNMLNFDFSNINSNCSGADEETISLIGSVHNMGTAFPAVPFDVNYYFDTDGSGNVNTGDSLIATFTENGPIVANGSLPISHSFAVSDAQVCGIIAFIDSTGLGICEVAEFALGEPQLLNAGDDQIFCELTPTTISANIGDPTCGSLAAYSYNWTAIAPALISDLSATDIPDPVLTVAHDAVIQDTLQYVLETTRPDCGGLTRDTINIIRALAITAVGAPTIMVDPGSTAVLSVDVTGGFAPFTYDWSPASSLSDPTAENPIATPLMDTDYVVTVTSASGCTATAIVEVRLGGACDGIDVSSVITVQSTCGNTDGEATINITGDPLNFNFIWSPNIGTPSTNGEQRSDLPFGGYKVIVEDASDASCLDSVFLLIENMDGPDATDVTTTPATCALADGSATILPANFIYDWENGFTGNTRTDLTAGTHFVTITDPADVNCQNAMMIVIEEDNPLSANVTVNQLPDCGSNNGSATISVLGGSGTYAFSWTGGTDTNNTLASGMNTVTITDQGGAGCELVYNFVLNDNVPQGNVSITDTLEISCAGAEDGGVAFDVVYDGGFNAPADTIITNGVQNFENSNLPPGDYCIVITDAANCTAGGACFTIEQTDPLVLDFTVIPDCNMGGAIDLEVQGGTPPYLFDWDDLAGTTDEEDRDSLSNGTYSISLTDGAGCEVSYAVDVPVCPPNCDFFIGSDTINTIGDCDSGIQICVNASISDTSIYEIYVDGGLYAGEFGDCNIDSVGVYTYANLFGQGNQGPYQITSWVVNGTTFTGEFQNIPDLIDSMNLWDPNGNWVADADGGLFIVGGDKGSTYSQIDVEVVNLGLTSFLGYSIGIEPGGFYLLVPMGLHEIIILDTLNNCADTVMVNAKCDSYLPDSYCDSTFVGITQTWCLDTLLFPGSIVSMENVCLDSSGTEVEFFIDLATLCVEFTGLQLGQDTACIEVCDSFGNCDTTILCTTVIPYLDPPILIDDCDTVLIGNPVVIDVKANDTIVGEIDSVYILDAPLYGSAIINLDCSATYVAGEEYCERADYFTYVVCNANGCDTAEVKVWLECSDIVIFTAVSPNGDGVNDIFYIANIEDYPNSELNIYNRWGNLVYNDVGYKNDWEGTFNDKKELPDGTYYYVLELNDPDDRRVFQGYLEIYR